jgi:hypothetical protein
MCGSQRSYGHDLRMCGRERSQGRERRTTMIALRRRGRGTVAVVPHTPVFCRKSLDLLDCKGVEFFVSDKEFATV